MIVISDEERKDFNEEEFDPTKEAFFSDLNNMEEEIASEAYELVEHALGLLNDGYYDDSIEVLRQAAGLYAQINKSAEVEAINNKISEIYLLKEKSFSEQFVSEELIEEKSIEYNAEDLIEEALQLADIDEYDEALERLEEAYRIYESENNESEIEIVKKYIDDIKIKKEKSELGEISEPSEKEIEKEEILDAKVKEGYELMNKASDLVKEKKYEEALTLYNKAYKIFEDLDKKPELQELDNLIAYAKREKAILSEEIGKKEVPEISKPIILEPSLTAKDEAYEEEKLKRVKEFEAKKKEEEEFQEYIRKTVDDAEAKAREYDLAIRKGNFDIECPYPEIIKTYTHIRDLLREKGWNDQVQIYQRQVQLYTEKLEKDKKLREIEAQKKQKQLEYEALLKRSTETEIESKTTEAISGEIPKEHKETLKLEKFEEQIDNMINEAERLAREYEFQIKKGKFEIECIYPKVIEIYEKIRDMVLEKGWEEEAKIYLTQIRKYKEKLERDKKIRELEEEKKRKQEEFKAFKTIKTGSIGLSAEKLKKLEEIQKLKEEEDNLRNRIDEMVKQAERMAREYELKIRKGHFEEECVYPEIIKIFEEIIKLVSEKGWHDEEAIYRTQIRKYKELLEKDKRLRELERKKLEKQKMYEEMQKVSRPTTLKEIKIAAKQAADKKEEELVDKAFKLMDEAEKLVKNYELKLKKEILLYDSPYEKAIELYQEAKELLKEAGWTSEAAKINHSIKLYKEKKIKDDKVRELERQKLKEKEERERIKKAEIEESSTLREQRIQELEAEKKKKEAIAESIFEIINEAERIVKDYEMSLKGGGILNYECPYEKVIDMYREARKRFEEIGWKEEASKLIN
ncbi:MAG: hypothetical protein ACTSQP_16165, partial [Promethearchaeota archaeon]